MKKRNLKEKEAVVRTFQRKIIQHHRLKELLSQLNVNCENIYKELKEILKNKEFDFSLVLTLYDRNVQWLDKIIKLLKEEAIVYEFDLLQQYLVFRKLNISMKEFYQFLDFRIRLGIGDERKIEDLLEQISLLNEELENLRKSEGNNQQSMGFQISGIFLNEIRQSFSNRNKELLN